MADFRLYIEKDPSSFWSLKDDWTSFLNEIPGANPFLTPHWIGISYEFFSSDRELFLVVVRDQMDRFTGAVPWALRKVDDHVEIEHAVPEDVCLYLDFPIDQRFRSEVLKGSLELVGREYPGARLSIRFPYIREDSPSLWSLQKLLDERGIESEKIEAGKLYYMDLPENYEDFLFSLKKRERTQLQKTEKRARRIADLNELELRSPEEINRGLDVFMRLYRLQKEDSGDTLTPGYEAFLREIFLVFSQQSWAALYILNADGWNVGALLALEFRGKAFVFAGAEDPQAKEIAPLALLMNGLIKSSISRGIRRIEILQDSLPTEYYPLKQVRYYIFKAEERPVPSPRGERERVSR